MKRSHPPKEYWVSGMVLSPYQAHLLALGLGIPRSSLARPNGVPASLDAHFASSSWSTACRAVARRDNTPGFLLITNFAVARAGAPRPALACDAWARRVRRALISDELRARFPGAFDFVDASMYRLAPADVPAFVKETFRLQRSGVRTTGPSPDQTDYAQFARKPRPAPAPFAPCAGSATSCSAHTRGASSDSEARATHASDASSARRSASPNLGYWSDAADSAAEEAAATMRPRPRPSPRSHKRMHGHGRPKRIGVNGDTDDADAGYDADTGYETCVSPS